MHNFKTKNPKQHTFKTHFQNTFQNAFQNTLSKHTFKTHSQNTFPVRSKAYFHTIFRLFI